MKRVCDWADMMLGMNVTSKRGSILTSCLVCSTCVTGHKVHGVFVPIPFTAALSRNLKLQMPKTSEIDLFQQPSIFFCFHQQLHVMYKKYHDTHFL